MLVEESIGFGQLDIGLLRKLRKISPLHKLHAAIKKKSPLMKLFKGKKKKKKGAPEEVAPAEEVVPAAEPELTPEEAAQTPEARLLASQSKFPLVPVVVVGGVLAIGVIGYLVFRKKKPQ